MERQQMEILNLTALNTHRIGRREEGSDYQYSD